MCNEIHSLLKICLMRVAKSFELRAGRTSSLNLSIVSRQAVATKEAVGNDAAVLEENPFADGADNSTERQCPLQFTSESEVDPLIVAYFHVLSR